MSQRLQNVSEDPKKCHNHEALPGPRHQKEIITDEIIANQMLHMKPQTHNQRNATEEPLWFTISVIVCLCMYGGPAKSFVTGSDYFSVTFYQTYFYYKPSKYSPFTETHFVTFLPSHEKQIDSLLLVSVGDTDN